MQSAPLLTQDELDFIQKIVFKPAQVRQPGAASRLALGERLLELLGQLGDDEHLSLDTHSDNQHLSFPLRLTKDGHSHSRLELGAPLIFEQGVSERPWRLLLPTPLALLDSDDRPSGLQALELSNSGMLVEYRKAGTPAKDQLLQLLLPQELRVHLRAQLVRRVSKTRYAYRLQTRNAEDEQALRQYLFDRHNEQ